LSLTGEELEELASDVLTLVNLIPKDRIYEFGDFTRIEGKFSVEPIEFLEIEGILTINLD